MYFIKKECYNYINKFYNILFIKKQTLLLLLMEFTAFSNIYIIK